MKALSHYKSEITHSSLEYATAARFYWVLVLDVFLGNAIVQAILRELDDLLDNFDVSSVLEAIGSSVPKSSFFFISYIIARIGVSLPVEMFRLGKVFTYYLTAPTRRTPAQERAAWSSKYFDFTSNLGNLHLLVLLGLVYALVAPLVCVAAWLYFYFAKYVYYNHDRWEGGVAPLVCVAAWLYFFFAKYVYYNQLLFVYDTKPYDTKGKIWPAIFDFFVINLAISQVILVGVLAVKQSPFLSLQMFLPLLTGLYYFVMTNRYSKAFHHVPLDVASLLNQRVAHAKDWKTCQLEQCIDQEVPKTPQKRSMDRKGCAFLQTGLDGDAAEGEEPCYHAEEHQIWDNDKNELNMLTIKERAAPAGRRHETWKILGSINRCHTRDVIISLIDGSNNPRTAEYKVNTKNNADLIARDDGSCLRSWNR
ncbi:hypothetical protein CYMTET_10860 [Cymbomonas tetramitiformis]|uniref:CSC1/OSCA1-like 7TM region domain-containing protein n=1 Tax=Cymbomonas tetramitiformis TaxID=36881 RepID=A0AAE0LDK4_9CHLO|nr:hypothetical protein CYMTET_10860 [Cymbomonas tetramitiformis]